MELSNYWLAQRRSEIFRETAGQENQHTPAIWDAPKFCRAPFESRIRWLSVCRSRAECSARDAAVLTDETLPAFSSFLPPRPAGRDLEPQFRSATPTAPASGRFSPTRREQQSDHGPSARGWLSHIWQAADRCRFGGPHHRAASRPSVWTASLSDRRRFRTRGDYATDSKPFGVHSRKLDNPPPLRGGIAP